MTWIREHLAPSPHLLDPAETEKASRAFWRGYSDAELRRHIADHARAIEHEQAVLRGMESTLAERQRPKRAEV